MDINYDILRFRPSTKDANELFRQLQDADYRLYSFTQNENKLRQEIVQALKALIEKEVKSVLANIDIDELNRGRQGIRLTALRQAGFYNLLQIYQTSEEKIYAHKGIGLDTAERVKEIVNDIAREIRKNTYPKLSVDYKVSETDRLVKALYAYRHSQELYSKARMLYMEYSPQIYVNIQAAKITGNGFLWFFSLKKKKISAVEAFLRLRQLEEDGYSDSVKRVLKRAETLRKVPKTIAWEDFQANSIDYFTIVEKIQGYRIKDTAVENGFASGFSKRY